MIYIPGVMCFVHIPRTSGMAICSAFASAAREASMIVSTCNAPGLMLRRHSRAVELQYSIPDWHAVWKWCVVREPCDIIESTFVLGKLGTIRHEETWAANDWLAFRERCRLHTIDTFIRDELDFLRMSGGYYSHWCMDGNAELGVDPVQYHDLPARWPEIVARCNIGRVPRRQRINSRMMRDSVLRDSHREEIRSICHLDYDRFAWPR